MAKIFATSLFLAILGLLGLPVSQFASAEALKWSAVNIPSEGKSGNWVLAGGSDVSLLTMAVDGTLYGYANPSGTGNTLFKSSDGGHSWSFTGGVAGPIVAIATAPGDAGVIAYATSSKVYKSRDAGNSFVQLPPGPGGTGTGNIEITSVAVFQQGGNSIIAIGTRDIDSSQYGGVYIFDERKSFTWVSAGIGSYDVYALAFSPAFATDGQLVAIVTDEADTFVTSRVGDSGWGQLISNARLKKDNSTAVAVDTSAGIAFPADYSAIKEPRILFVAIDAGAENGDVYRINLAESPAKSVATDLNAGSASGLSNLDVTGLAVAGNTASPVLVAGAAGSAQVYSSRDGGVSWAASSKPPTGQSRTFVAVSTKGDRAYAATSGTQSAFSYSIDGGANWDQVGLIDTAISATLDFAVSPFYEQDETMFLLTFGGKHSLWRSRDSGDRWERVFSGALPGVDSITGIRFAPDSGGVLFASGASSGRPVLWKSTDGGQSFASSVTADPVGGAPFNMDAWAVVDENTLLVASYDGTNGVVYYTSNGGLFYKDKAKLGTSAPCSIALSPTYSQDKTILAGTTSGSVYLSDDGGSTFEPLPPGAVPPLSGNVSVAFDAGFAANKTVYAASDSLNKGIYRFVIGKSTTWESIDGTLPAGSRIGHLKVSPEGVLYAVNSGAGAGMERSLNPSYASGATFETLSGGLSSNTALNGLWLNGEQLWSIDTVNNRLVTCLDSLTLPPVLTSPPDKVSGVEVKNIKIDWEALTGATKYRWQVDSDADFSAVPAGFEDDTTASFARLPALEPGTLYYWRVRAVEPVAGPWSARHSFTTSLSSAATTPGLITPGPGARNLPLNPVFQWESVYGALSYELLISSDVSFANPVVARTGDFALPATAWQCSINLDYGTAYYWKVRALNNNNSSAWSPVSIFTTEPKPEPPVILEKTPSIRMDGLTMPSLSPSSSPSPVAAPLPPQSQDIPDWAKWLIHMGAALLAVLGAILVALIVLIVKIRKT